VRFNPQLYIPCLRWKQGEYQALNKLSSIAQDSIMPLIEVAEIGFDFESRTCCKTIDEHLYPFAKRVRDKWGKKECFVDIRHIGASKLMANGQHPGTFVFDDLRSKGVLATPVTGMILDPQFQAAVHQVVSVDGRGLCLRVNIEEVAKVSFDSSMHNLIRRYGLAIEQCDLIIDLRAPNFEPLDGFTGLLLNIIRNLPNLELWRSIGIIGTSFPTSLSGLKKGTSIIPRDEWRLYKLLEADLKEHGIRVPSFGDYAINHPDQLSVDMRIVKPNASVRYTINDKWLIAKGQNVRDYGFAQYEELCQMVVESNYYCGQQFSMGDEYIFACANNQVSKGNLTTWRWVGTNHHIEMVVRDVANLAAS
jgi:hypothetical protein